LWSRILSIKQGGGDFATLTSPDLLLDDIWQLLGGRETSVTNISVEGVDDQRSQFAARINNG
jgi:hypothetical protein